MRILRLDLLAFGPFQDVSLALDQGSQALQLVYGDNEAGKSTALRALRQLLYGIPQVSRDNFRHPYPKLRVGAVLEDDQGGVLEVIRRKGRKHTLRAADDATPVDEKRLQRLLAGVDEPAYCHQFGIDYASLVEGGRAIVQGQGEVGRSLFAAASGLAGLSVVQQRLVEQADALFRPAASVLPVNKLIAELLAARQQLRQAQLPSELWQRHQLALEQAERDRQQVETDLVQLQARRRRLDRLDQALPLVVKRARLLDDLEPLADVPSLSGEFEDQRRAASSRWQAAAQALAEADEERQQALEELEALPPQLKLIEHAAEIDGLYRQLGSHQKAMLDLPSLVARRDQLQGRICAILRDELGWDEPTEEAAGGRPPQGRLPLSIRPVDRQRIQELARRHEAVVQRLDESQQQLENLERKRQRLDEQHAALAPPLDGAPLRAVLRRIQQHGDVDARLAESRRRFEQSRSRAEAELQRLGLCSGQLDGVVRLPVPAVESVERFEAELADAAQQLEQAREQAREAANGIRRLEGELRQLERAHDVPARDELATARRRRDQAWQLLRRELEGDPADAPASQAIQRQFPNAATLAEAFQLSMVAADELADRLWRQAERVAQKATLEEQLEQFRQRERQAAAQLEERNARWAVLERQWSELWRPSGIEPLTPREMRGWLGRWSKLVAAMEQLEVQQSDVEALERCREQSLRELSDCLTACGHGVAGAATIARLRDDADRLLAEHEQAAQRRAQLEIQRQEIVGSIQETRQRVRASRDQLDAWRSGWREAVAPLQLPAEASYGQAAQVLAQIEEVEKNLQQVEDLADRVGGIEEEARGFAERARQLAARVEAPADNDPQSIAAALYERLAAAREHQARRVELQRQCRQLDERLERYRHESRTAAALLETLCRDAGCRKIDELPAVEQKARQKRQAERDLEQIEDQLRQLAAGARLEAFVADAQTQDADQLATNMRRLDDQLRELGERRDALISQIAEQRCALEQMDGAADAAELQESIQQIQARLEEAAARYVRLRLASRVLRQAIEQYRQRHQDPVLRRASQLFRELTLGSFAGLRADYGEDGRAVLVGVRPDDRQTVPVDGMSDGSCDQLYLALRLASVEHHLEHHSPLPLVVDDILIQFDDLRAVAALKQLAELSRNTQVIFFTHHEHLVQLAREHLPADALFVHRLDGSTVAAVEP